MNGITPEWRSLDSAPRDGTVIEFMCTYGTMPWFGLCHWVEPPPDWEQHGFAPSTFGQFGWQIESTGGLSGMGGGTFVNTDSVRWRPYNRAVSGYVDPTGGRQQMPEYWGGVPGAFDVKPRRRAAYTKLPDTKRGFWSRLFGG